MDTEVEAAAEATADEEATWSRAWEWPAWLRALGSWRAARGWRPDGRTLGVVFAVVYAQRVAAAIPLASPAWHTLTARADAFGFQSVSAWERLAAYAELGDLLVGALMLPAAALLVLRPRRLAGYLLAVAGLLAGLLTACGWAAFGFRETFFLEYRVGYAAGAGGALLLLVLGVYAALRARAPLE